MRSPASLLRNARGTATIEFAIASLFMFGTMVVGLDFGVYVQQKLKLGGAVAQGAMLAFNQRDMIVASDVASYVQSLAGLSSTPSVTCNNGASCKAKADRGSSDYRCLNATTGAVGTTGYSAGATCPDGSLAGYYLTISASKGYSATIVPDRYLGGSTITQTAVVRLQ